MGRAVAPCLATWRNRSSLAAISPRCTSLNLACVAAAEFVSPSPSRDDAGDGRAQKAAVVLRHGRQRRLRRDRAAPPADLIKTRFQVQESGGGLPLPRRAACYTHDRAARGRGRPVRRPAAQRRRQHGVMGHLLPFLQRLQGADGLAARGDGRLGRVHRGGDGRRRADDADDAPGLHDQDAAAAPDAPGREPAAVAAAEAASSSSRPGGAAAAAVPAHQRDNYAGCSTPSGGWCARARSRSTAASARR